jgi:histidine triad (HIT) family protein
MPTIQGKRASLRLLRGELSHILPGGPTSDEDRTMLQDNIFQKIIDRKIPATIVHEDDLCVAFRDINPQAPVHVLIVPRKVIRTHDEITAEDKELLGHLHFVAAQLAGKLGLFEGYRLVLNCKETSGQTVPHLHLHLLGGREFLWPPG